MIICVVTISSQRNSLVSSMATTLHLFDECGKSLARGYTVDTVYLDFNKAFDTVSNHHLHGKLNVYDNDESLLSWIFTFLMGPTQKVSVHGSHSSSKPVLSGIPQGSVKAIFYL